MKSIQLMSVAGAFALLTVAAQAYQSPEVVLALEYTSYGILGANSSIQRWDPYQDISLGSFEVGTNALGMSVDGSNVDVLSQLGQNSSGNYQNLISQYNISTGQLVSQTAVDVQGNSDWAVERAISVGGGNYLTVYGNDELYLQGAIGTVDLGVNTGNDSSPYISYRSGVVSVSGQNSSNNGFTNLYTLSGTTLTQTASYSEGEFDSSAIDSFGNRMTISQNNDGTTTLIGSGGSIIYNLGTQVYNVQFGHNFTFYTLDVDSSGKFTILQGTDLPNSAPIFNKQLGFSTTNQIQDLAVYAAPEPKLALLPLALGLLAFAKRRAQ